MLEYIYVCRHGFRSNWIDPDIKTGPTGMNRDPPLAPYGLQQAQQLAAFLSRPDIERPEGVFSSAFYRCIQTAEPTARSLGLEKIRLDHGVGEWYSTVRPGTGLHPRPGSAKSLDPLFPGLLDLDWPSTVYPSRRGETLDELQARLDLWAEAWTSRVEELGCRCVVVFAHAASVIAIGRALTGNRNLDISAGSASCSLYRRRGPGTPDATSKELQSIHQRGTTTNISDSYEMTPSIHATFINSDNDLLDQRAGQWDPVWLGRADYLDNGVERDWSFRDVAIVDGQVIQDDGDHGPHPADDEIPCGLGPGMDRYLKQRPADNSLNGRK